MAIEFGYVTLRKTGDTFFDDPQNNIPQAATTVTLYDNSADGGYGARFKRLILGINSAQASAASGVFMEESTNNGVNWESPLAAPNDPKSLVAATWTRFVWTPGAPRWRLRYTGNGVTPATFRWSLLGDMTTPS